MKPIYSWSLSGILSLLIVAPVSSQTLIKTFSGHAGAVACVCVSSDGKYLASGGYDRRINLWDLEKRRFKTKLGRQKGWVTALCFSRDNKVIASLGDDKRLNLWEVATGKHRATFQTPLATSLTFGLDSRTVVLGCIDGTVRFRDRISGQIKKTLTSKIDSLYATQVSPDGKLLAAAGAWAGEICFWDAVTQKARKSLRRSQEIVTSVSFSPDGLFFASTGVNSYKTKTKRSPGVVKVWNVRTSRAIFTRKVQGLTLGVVQISPNGKLLACAGGEPNLELWNLKTGKTKATLKGQMGLVTDVCFSPDGTLLVAANDEGTLQLWDVSKVK